MLVGSLTSTRKPLGNYADVHGYVMLDQITAADIDLFWANWKLGARAKGKRLTTLRAFFRFCVNRKWILESPVSPDIKAPVGSSKAANKAPFTDDEITRILAACDQVKVEWRRRALVSARRSISRRRVVTSATTLPARSRVARTRWPMGRSKSSAWP
jgi:site-specific recombinase XerD